MINRAMQYSESQIKTAGKLKSLQMLHEGGTRFLRDALHDSDKRGENIIKAQNIIAQVQMALRLDEGGVSEILFHLYSYMYDHLENADEKGINEIIGLFDHLGQTYRMVGQRRTMVA